MVLISNFKTIKTPENIGIYFIDKNHPSPALAEISNYSLFSKEIYNMEGNIWYFNRLNVPKVLRNQGIATQLMTKLVNILKEENITLICDVNPYGDLNFDQLVNFYKKFGFQETNQGYLIFKGELHV